MKTLLDDTSLSDEEVMEIREGLYGLAEVIFDKWQQDNKNKMLNNKE